MIRRVLVLMVLLLAPVIVVRPGTGVAAPLQAKPAGLDIVQAGYDVLLDLFYQPTAPADLLNAGWNAAVPLLRPSDPAVPQSLGALPPGREEAFAAFSTVYAGTLACGKVPATLTPPALAFVITDGMARSLHEQHTNFLLPALYRSLLTTLGAGELPVGPGLHWTTAAPRIVTAVAANGPAAKAGAQVGDVIATIDGKEPTQTALLTLLYPQLFGVAADKSTLFGMDRAGQRISIAITNGPYDFPVVQSRLLPGGAGYLRLDQFVQSSAPLANGVNVLDDIDRRLDSLDAQGATGLVLDLRGNSGGSGATATELLGRFLPEDALTEIDFDERGHEVTGIASGQMRRVQHPLVVLVNGESASASETTASALHENHRALLVGTKTEGALAGSLVLPLPQDAGLQVAVVEAVAAYSRTKIDGVGVPVDREVADSRTPDDYRAGKDPQLDAAVAALAQAPAPPAFKSTGTGLSRAQVQSLLGKYAPDAGQIPTSGRLSAATIIGSRDFNHVNEAIDDTRNPLARQQVLRQRGFLGRHQQTYGASLFQPPTVTVTTTLYANATGAAAAVADPGDETSRNFAPPLQLGDETAAYEGIGFSSGSRAIAWRRGTVVFQVAYSDLPGNVRDDLISAVAQQVDAAYQAAPLSPAAYLPAATPAMNASATAAAAAVAATANAVAATAAIPLSAAAALTPAVALQAAPQVIATPVSQAARLPNASPSSQSHSNTGAYVALAAAAIVVLLAAGGLLVLRR